MTLSHNKITHLQFVQKLEDNYRNRYTLLSEFTDFRTKLHVRCNLCSHEWDIRPDVLLKGHCPGCSKIKRSKSTEEFNKELTEIHGGKYALVSQYINSQTKVQIKCFICSNIWAVLPSNLLSRKSGCPECSKRAVGESNMLSHEDFTTQIEAKYPNRYTLLSQYTGFHCKILVRCNVDGYEWQATASTLYKGACPKCGKKVRRTEQGFLDEVRVKYGDEYTILDGFTTARQKVRIRHNICGQEWCITPDKFLMQNRRCPKCYGNNLKKHEEFEREVWDRFKERYSILGLYTNNRTHMPVKCNRCGNEWLITPSNLLRGFGCPMCNVSKGEDKIKDCLKTKNIDFKFQYTFRDLYGENGWPLKFDFALFHIDRLICLIEYDGLLHYELGGFQTQEKFDLQKSYDRKKNIYCKENRIPLYRIPYWKEDSIEKIVEDIVKAHYSTAVKL